MPKNAIEYIIIIFYMLVLSNLGRFFKAFNKNSSDYFRGGGRTTWWLLGVSIWMGAVSATVFTGVAGAVYESGLAPLASNWAIVAAGFLMATFLAAWFRQLRLITSVEVVRDRFGALTEQIYAYIAMILQPVYGGFQLFALCIFVSSIFGFPLQPVILAVGVMIAFYAVTGGKWAVMAADFLQFLVLVPVSILVAVLAVIKIGGPGAFIQRSAEAGMFTCSHPAGAFPGDKYTWGWIAAVFFMGFVGQLHLNGSSRFFAAKDGREAKRASWLLVVLFTLGTVVFSIPAMVAKVIYSEQVPIVGAALNKPMEAAYVTVCQNLLPTGLIGLVILAMFAASVSSMDGAVNSNAAVIARNILPPVRRFFKKKELTPESELLAGRITSLLLIVYITCIALFLSGRKGMGIFELVLTFGAFVGLPTILPAFLALFFRRAPRCSALISIFAGLVLPHLLWLPLLKGQGVEITFQLKVLVVSVSGILGFFLGYLFPRTDSAEVREQIKEFYVRMRTPVDFEKEVGRANDYSQMLIVGRLSLLVAALLLLLLIIPNPLWARGSILALAGSVGFVGTLLLQCAKRHARKAKENAPRF